MKEMKNYSYKKPLGERYAALFVIIGFSLIVCGTSIVNLLDRVVGL